MSVSDLICALQAFPPDLPVYAYSVDGGVSVPIATATVEDAVAEEEWRHGYAVPRRVELTEG